MQPIDRHAIGEQAKEALELPRDAGEAEELTDILARQAHVVQQIVATSIVHEALADALIHAVAEDDRGDVFVTKGVR